MENDILHASVDMTGQHSFVLEGVPSQTISSSLVLPDSLDLNRQNPTLAGYPVLSALQGELLLNPSFDPSIHSRPGAFDSGTFVASLGRNLGMEYQEQSSGGQTVSTNLFAPLLASSSENFSNLAVATPSVYPVEFFSYNHTDVNSSIVGDMNCHGDVLSGMNKFHGQPETVGKSLARTEFQSFHQSSGNVESNGWMPADGAIVSMGYPYGSPSHTNELSLSLASYQPSVIDGSSSRDQRSEMSCSGVTRHCFNEPSLGTDRTSSRRNDLSLSCASTRSVQRSHVILGSRYLQVIQEILAQVASYAITNLDLNSYSSYMTQMHANASLSSSCSGDTDSGPSFMGYDEIRDVDGRPDDQADPALHRQAIEAKKTQLLTLLEVVDEQYNQCLDEIHTVVSAFHAATELDPQIHTRFVLQTIAFLYKNLRERISNQIIALGVHFKSKSPIENERSTESCFIQKQLALQQLKRRDQLWRPQRGLPERSVSVLRAWMFQNFLHPYPKDSEKHLLAVKSGLTRSQVSNWFINARVRLWKPMIEEMYAEMNRRKARRNEEGNGGINNPRFNVSGTNEWR